MSLYQNFLESINKWRGKHIDKDNMYGAQCVDWVRQYALDIGCPITTFGNARGFATIGLGKNWERVEGEAWIGDIVVQPRGTYGHIAVVERIGKNTLYVMEQNRNGKANKNNNPKNLGSPVSQGKYKILGDEVYFRPVPKTRKSTNMKARPGYKGDDPKYPIIDQGPYGECAGASILSALIRMKDGVDHKKIMAELIAEKGNELTMKRASEWYIKKGYIKGIRKASYSKPLLMRQPLITQIYNIDWEETGKTNNLTIKKREIVGSHWVCVATAGKIANSYGKKWGDNGYMYFTDEQAKTMKLYYTIIV